MGQSLIHYLPHSGFPQCFRWAWCLIGRALLCLSEVAKGQRRPYMNQKWFRQLFRRRILVTFLLAVSSDYMGTVSAITPQIKYRF